jgi:hypothetical protein
LTLKVVVDVVVADDATEWNWRDECLCSNGFCYNGPPSNELCPNRFFVSIFPFLYPLLLHT